MRTWSCMPYFISALDGWLKLNFVSGIRKENDVYLYKWIVCMKHVNGALYLITVLFSQFRRSQFSAPSCEQSGKMGAFCPAADTYLLTCNVTQLTWTCVTGEPQITRRCWLMSMVDGPLLEKFGRDDMSISSGKLSITLHLTQANHAAWINDT